MNNKQIHFLALLTYANKYDKEVEISTLDGLFCGKVEAPKIEDELIVLVDNKKIQHICLDRIVAIAYNKDLSIFDKGMGFHRITTFPELMESIYDSQKKREK